MKNNVVLVDVFAEVIVKNHKVNLEKRIVFTRKMTTLVLCEINMILAKDDTVLDRI